MGQRGSICFSGGNEMDSEDSQTEIYNRVPASDNFLSIKYEFQPTWSYEK